MRFHNLSRIRVNKTLWQDLAKAIGVDGRLPGAIADKYGIYIGHTLRITVRPQMRRGWKSTPDACYTYGHITFYPCPKCTFAFLTNLYLHELFHAWLHQTDDKLYTYWDHCSNAEDFADTGYRLLGGQIPKSGSCGNYVLDVGAAMESLSEFRNFAGTLTSRRGELIKNWKAGSATRRQTTACT